jgi:hypothetical protein
MKRTTRTAALALVGVLTLATFPAAGPAQAPVGQAGFQLLDRLVVLLVRSVAPGAKPVDLDQAVLSLAKNLKAAREAKQVDELFAIRYSRMLSAVRQAVLRDPDVLYWPMYRSRMIDFIEERTGQMPDLDKLLFMVNDHGGSGVGLAAISDAVMSEVVSLHLHLETLGRRPDVLKSYMEKGLKEAGAGK